MPRSWEARGGIGLEASAARSARARATPILALRQTAARTPPACRPSGSSSGQIGQSSTKMALLLTEAGLVSRVRMTPDRELRNTRGVHHGVAQSAELIGSAHPGVTRGPCLERGAGKRSTTSRAQRNASETSRCTWGHLGCVELGAHPAQVGSDKMLGAHVSAIISALTGARLGDPHIAVLGARSVARLRACARCAARPASGCRASAW